MKSLILALLILALPILSNAQWYENLRDVGPPLNPIQRTQHFVRNTGSGIPLRLMFETRDTCWVKFWTDSVIINYLGTSNHGFPSGNLLWADAFGVMRGTPMSSLFFADSSIIATRSWVNGRGFLTSYTETDPIWTAASGNYFTKTQSDGRYLQSFTEVDPVWTLASSNYYTKTQGDARYLQSYTETDPIWTSASTNYFTKTQSDARYLQSFTETDPLFNTKFAAKSTTDLIEGTNLYYTPTRFNTAFSGKSTTDLTEGSNQYFTISRARTSLSAGTGISYNNSTGVITNSSPDQTVVLNNGTGISNTGTYPNFTITNTAPDQTVSIASGTGISATGTYPSFTITNTGLLSPTLSTPARVLSTTGANNTFTISASRASYASYSINIAYALTLTTSNGQVDLDYSTNGGSSWVNVSSISNAITLAITLSGNSSAVLSGWIPANALVRINRVANTNTTITISRQQEVTL